MRFFRQTNRRALLVLSLLLSLALLCAQEVRLHVHSLDHNHGDHLSHSIDDAGGHAHLSKAHFAQDMSHSDHHDGAVADVDISPDGLLKNFNDNIFAVALIAFFFALLLFVSSRQFVHHSREGKLILHRRYVLSPPLRAPPQY